MPDDSTTQTNTDTGTFVSINGNGYWDGSGQISFNVEKKSGMTPKIYFKYIKKKLSTLEGMRVKNRLKKLEKLFYKSIEDGQEALSEKFLGEIAREARETEIVAKGIKLFIEKGDLDKYKNKIRNGHISDTMLKDYTRVIPKDVLKKKKKVEDVFDDFIIYHYWDESVKDVKKMSSEEKSNMKDPVLFGMIKESSRYYFVADWDDEYCDLTFDEMVDELGKDEEDITIKNPKLKEE